MVPKKKKRKTLDEEKDQPIGEGDSDEFSFAFAKSSFFVLGGVAFLTLAICAAVEVIYRAEGQNWYIKYFQVSWLL